MEHVAHATTRQQEPPDPGEPNAVYIDPSVLRSNMNTQELSMMQELLNICSQFSNKEDHPKMIVAA